MQELLVGVGKPSHIHIETGSNHLFSESAARLEKQMEEVVLLKPWDKVLSQDHGRHLEDNVMEKMQPLSGSIRGLEG